MPYAGNGACKCCVRICSEVRNRKTCCKTCVLHADLDGQRAALRSAHACDASDSVAKDIAHTVMSKDSQEDDYACVEEVASKESNNAADDKGKSDNSN